MFTGLLTECAAGNLYYVSLNFATSLPLYSLSVKQNPEPNFYLHPFNLNGSRVKMNLLIESALHS